MAVGDVNSQERGTGARFNDGKVPLELVPVRVFLSMYNRHLPSEISAALHALARFQEGDDFAVYAALQELRTDNLRGAAWVLDHGRTKYAEWNWAKGMPWSVCFGCILRHALAIAEGESTDPESGLLHADHIACNLIFLAHYARNYREGDDRPRPEWMNPAPDPSGAEPAHISLCASPRAWGVEPE